MTVESVTQSVSNLALSFGDDDADAGAMVRKQWNLWCQRQQIPENFLERDIQCSIDKLLLVHFEKKKR